MSFALELLVVIEFFLGIFCYMYGLVSGSLPLFLLGATNILIAGQLAGLNEVTKKCK